jgi:hypothetical protein
MHPTRITVLGLFAVAMVACGITAVGLKPLDEVSDGASSSSSSSSASSSSSSGGAEDSGVVDPDDGGAGDAATDAIADVGLDVAPLVPPYLIVTHAPVTTFDLTAEGTKEWGYWGYNGSNNSFRTANAAYVIGNLFSDGTTITNTTGFGATLSWSNGPSGNEMGSSDWYRSWGTDGVTGYVSIRAPSGPTKQRFTVLVGGANLRGKMTISLVDATVASKVDNSYSNLSGSFVAKYSVEYASVGVTSVEMRWTPDVVATNAELRFTAAALR